MNFINRPKSTKVNKIIIASLLLAIALSTSNVKAKDHDMHHAVSLNALKQIGRLKVFFEGHNLDFDYIKRNIDFVDFVNDPMASDVHVIITQNQTGGGGIN